LPLAAQAYECVPYLKKGICDLKVKALEIYAPQFDVMIFCGIMVEVDTSFFHVSGKFKK
jgi:hypothetical protein